jgi:hypothetical protein
MQNCLQLRVVQAFRVDEDGQYGDHGSMGSDRSIDRFPMSSSLMNTHQHGLHVTSSSSNHRHQDDTANKNVVLAQRTSSPTPYPYYHRGQLGQPPLSPHAVSPTVPVRLEQTHTGGGAAAHMAMV